MRIDFEGEEMTSREKLYRVQVYLEKSKVRYDSDVELSSFSYFRSGGLAKLLVLPRDKEELASFVRFMFAEEIEYKLIGATSNLMFLDDRNYGVLVSLQRMNNIFFDEKEKMIVADAGADLPELSRVALRQGFEGFEGLEGIPGTVGGAVFMNAGAYDCEIKDHLIRVQAIRKDGALCELSCEELKLAHRTSLLKNSPGEYIVIRTFFSAQPGDTEKIFLKMELYHAKRHKYQDFLYPTLGSLFSTRDLYSELGHKDKRFLACLWVFKKFVYSKRFRRETPMNRILLNRFVCRYFGWNFLVQPFSNKTMNCLTNRGQHTDRLLEYIELLKRHLPDSVRIENEVLTEFLFDG